MDPSLIYTCIYRIFITISLVWCAYFTTCSVLLKEYLSFVGKNTNNNWKLHWHSFTIFSFTYLLNFIKGFSTRFSPFDGIIIRNTQPPFYHPAIFLPIFSLCLSHYHSLLFSLSLSLTSSSWFLYHAFMFESDRRYLVILVLVFTQSPN